MLGLVPTEGTIVDFTGFLLSENGETIAQTLSVVRVDPPMRVISAGPRVALLLAEPPHTLSENSSINEAIAARLAAAYGQCLVIYNADSLSLRVAELYDATGFLEAFGELDEIWVPVTDAGFVDTKGPRLTSADVAAEEDPDRRYVCLFNGIDAGLLRVTGNRELTSDRLARLALDGAASIRSVS